MRILVAGPGALGTIYAAGFAHAGQSVAVFSRPATAATLRAAGSRFRVTGFFEAAGPVDVVTSGTAAGPVDFLLLTVKTPDTGEALAALAGLEFTSDGAALSVQNGVAKDDHLAAVFGRDRVLGAAAVIGAELMQPGHARCTLLSDTTVGELAPGHGRSPRADRFASLCEAARLPARVADDIVSVEWRKLCGFLPGALVTALSRRVYYEMLLDDDLRTLFIMLAQELVAVARGEGAALTRSDSWPDPVFYADAPEDEVHADLRALAARQRDAGQRVRPSMFQDVLAGRVTEVEDTAGDVVRRAAARSIAVPAVQSCYRLLRGLERGFSGGG